MVPPCGSRDGVSGRTLPGGRRGTVSVQSQFTVPNALTASRIAMALGAVWIAVAGASETAVLVLIAAALLDAFDGWYARTFSQCSSLGAHLDPVADKILMGVVYAWIGLETDSTLVWTLIALVAARELTMTAFRSYSLRRHRRFIPASRLGRFKMLAQSMVGLAVLSVMHFLDRRVPEPAIVAALAPILVISYASAAGYLSAWRSARVSRPSSGLGGEAESEPARQVSAGR